MAKYELKRLVNGYMYIYIRPPNSLSSRSRSKAGRSNAWTVFVRFNTGVVASNPTRGMDVCVRLFGFCVVLCVGSGLATGWSPVQGVLTYLLTYGTEPFLRSRQLCSHSRTSQHVMVPEGSSPCSKEPSTGPYPEPDRSSPHHPILSMIHFNIVYPSMSWSS
jgi:hypothetical protein